MKQLLIGVLCVLSFFVIGQNEDVNIKIGTPIKYDRGAYSEIFNVNNVNYLVRKISESKIELTKFNTDLQLNKVSNVELAVEGNKVKLANIFISGESIVIISRRFVKKVNKEAIYRHIIDMDKLTIIKQEKIADISLALKHEKEYRLKLFFANSPKDSKFLVFYEYLKYVENSTKKKDVGILVFDSQFKLMWKKKSQIPLLSKYEKLLIDDNGAVYLLNKKISASLKGGGNYYNLIKYTKEDMLVAGVDKIELEKGKVHYLTMKLYENEIILGGLTTSTLNDLPIIGGAFFTLEKSSLRMIKSYDFQFEDKYIKHNLMQSLTPNPTFNEKGQEYSYYLKDIFISDNYISLIAEQVTSETFKSGTIQSRWESGSYNYSTTTVVYNMDVIITQVKKDFSEHRVSKITKVQASLNNSIVTKSNNNTIHVLYNDRPGNPSAINPDKLPMTHNIGKCLVKRVSLREDGEFYENTFTTNDKRTYIVPSILSNNVGDKLIFYTNKSKEGKLVEYTFKK